MSDSCQTVTEVIAIEDDDEEDVEVVFSNLSKTCVYRNLMHQKISQEIELLQAMSKQTVPNEFDQFKELAKKLGFQYSDDIIRSAWERVMKRCLMKLKCVQRSKTPICLVTPRQSTIKSPPQADPPLPSRLSSVTLTSPSHNITSFSHPTASAAVPIALLMNQCVRINNSYHPSIECSMKYPKLISAQETLADDKNIQTARCSVNNQVFPMPESIHIEMDTISVGKKEVFNYENSFGKRESETNIFSTELEKRWSKSELEESDQNDAKNQNSFSSNVTESYFYSAAPKQNQLSVNENVKKKCPQKRKSSSKQVKAVHTPETDPVVAKSHVGIKAKILRTSPAKSKKRLIKEMSEAELKEFKAEQKRLKYQQKCELEMQQIQKVHDRLVDVLIPKYHINDPNEKG